MTGQCIISFDCESKWGLMDSLNDTHDQIFSSQNINQAYIDILSILKHFDLPATFAFVGASYIRLDSGFEFSEPSSGFPFAKLLDDSTSPSL